MRTEKHTVKAMAAALVHCDGLVTLAAKRLNMSFQGLYLAIKRHPELQKIIEETNEQLVDIAENALKNKIMKGDVASIIFTLKTKGKSRGWVERQEIEMKPARYEIIVPEEADDRGMPDADQ